MRLINSTTLKMHEFGDGQEPIYVALSHTWGDEEITYQDMLNLNDEAMERSGYRKIVNCARICTRYGWDWIWIDTCCIDKSSSAELSEAINSMYTWYSNCILCYVYLDDYHFTSDDLFGTRVLEINQAAVEQFKQCRWFSRGWTLQELLAPHDVCFFNLFWEIIGYKLDIRVTRYLSEITSIPISALSLDSSISSEYSIAQKMSWASRRETTRREDIAYCLLGLFDVNMPLLYGEGDKAFIRLQEEIIKRTDDRSIFLWTSKTGDGDCYRGLLARHPSEFSDCSNICSLADSRNEIESRPFTMTNRGLEMHIRLQKPSQQTISSLDLREYNEEDNLYLLPSDCFKSADQGLGSQIPLHIVLKRLEISNQFARVQPHRLFEEPMELHASVETIYVRQVLRPSLKWSFVNLYGIQLSLQESRYPERSWRYGFGDGWKVKYPGSETSNLFTLATAAKLCNLTVTFPITISPPRTDKVLLWFTVRSDLDTPNPEIYINLRDEEEPQPPLATLYKNRMRLGDRASLFSIYDFCKPVLIKDRFVLHIGLSFQCEMTDFVSILKERRAKWT